MSQPYIGEIRIFAGNFAPNGWAFCEGQLLPISENDALFNLIGTTYGGDGQATFALPDLRGRLPTHQGTASDGSTFTIGEQAGAETQTLTASQIPSHTHTLTAVSDAGTQVSPAGNLPATSLNVVPFIADVPAGAFAASAVSTVGGSQPHENRQPFLCLSFIISLFGIFPSQT